MTATMLTPLLAAAAEGGEAANPVTDWLLPSVGAFWWTLVAFGVTVFLLGKFAWKPLLEALEKRDQRIADDLDQAAQARDQAETLLDEYKQQLAEAQKDVNRMLEEGREANERRRGEIEDEARQAATELLERARREIEMAKQDALADLKDATIDLSLQVAGEVLERNFTDADDKRLAEEAVDRLGGLKL